MRILAMVAATVIGAIGCAGETGPAPERSVTVCMDRGDYLVSMARPIAGKIFEEIGVKIDWRYSRFCKPSDGFISISLLENTPVKEYPRALAYAMPYEGTHIVVHHDRVRERAGSSHAREPALLAYVLVHEITHILQGLKRHSESGIMKAAWGPRDYSQIQWRSLVFDEGDVDLIYRGLQSRGRVTTASLALLR